MGPVKQVEKAGIRRPALELQPQLLVKRFPVPAGKGLQITGAAAAALGVSLLRGRSLLEEKQ
ncbi:MAG TPA: hypothetical protein DDY43_13290 [Synechococcales bacterium UBA10510]|nr:hypothetical protein [Synechococcales bacterium UBA10510]